MSFLSEVELEELGLRQCGRKVLIDRTVKFLGPERVNLGDNVRIDHACVISSGDDGIEIGSHIHIASGCFLFGGGGLIRFEDFAGLSPGAMIFTASDDFVEGWLRGPQLPSKYRKVKQSSVLLRENAIVGAGSVVLPGVTFGRNSCAGALTVVSSDVEDNLLVVGNPARVVARRDGELSQQLITRFRHEWDATFGEKS